jgi:hypothetical protein
MKVLIATLVLVSTSLLAESPTEMWLLRQNMRHTDFNVSIQSVDEPAEVCQAESRKRGFGGFSVPVQACTFWEGKNCMIFLGRKINNDIFGHEMRHCLQGAFH